VFKLSNLKPAQVIVIGFLFIILFGAFLLSMPFASQDGKDICFLDALFTASSAVCVTGLVVINTLEHWSIFGKIIILFLIQIGGIGFMSLVTIIMVFLGKRITLKERIIIQESFNLSHFHGMVSFVTRIVKGTLIIETIGAVILSLRFIPEYGFSSGIFKGIFHSVSAFCNAGFDILGKSSLIPYSNDIIINVVIMLLIIIGGLGFTVWIDIINFFKSTKERNFTIKRGFRNLSLHSKIVLIMTFSLIIFGWIFFFVSEFANYQTIGGERIDHKLLISLFQSVSLRTAGFDTINQSGLNYSSKLMSIILMAIGGSPGGTAGGIKTVTIGVIILSIRSVIKGSDSINVFRRSISFYNLQKSLSVTMMIFSCILLSTMLLSFSEVNMNYDYEFIDLLFETTSALGTVGITVGITPYLSSFGKVVIIICMFIGRLGPVTIAVALAAKQNRNQNLIHYPEEKVLVG